MWAAPCPLGAHLYPVASRSTRESSALSLLHTRVPPRWLSRAACRGILRAAAATPGSTASPTYARPGPAFPAATALPGPAQLRSPLRRGGRPGSALRAVLSRGRGAGTLRRRQSRFRSAVPAAEAACSTRDSSRGCAGAGAGGCVRACGRVCARQPEPGRGSAEGDLQSALL